jgi:hypothetical protein
MTTLLTEESCRVKCNSLAETLAGKPCLSQYPASTFWYKRDLTDPYDVQPYISICRNSRNTIHVMAHFQMQTGKDFLPLDSFQDSGDGEISYHQRIDYEEEIEDVRRMILDIYARVHYKVARDLFGRE